ncbi:hypothetical protein DFH09DRAFT_1070352 [Mycena vulgaris]|nr:hypothetical protein DFH09DRAFT_1070352 [Mycena vulgaris]
MSVFRVFCILPQDVKDAKDGPAVLLMQIDDDVENSRRFVSRVFQNPPAAYLQAYDTTTTSAGQVAVNFTAQDRFVGAGGADASVPTDQYVWTIAFVPYSTSNVEEGALVNAAGTVCVFYNTTDEAQTHFFNGTQESTVTVVELHDVLNTSFKGGAYKLYKQDGGIYIADGTNTVGFEGVSYAPGRRSAGGMNVGCERCRSGGGYVGRVAL